MLLASRGPRGRAIDNVGAAGRGTEEYLDVGREDADISGPERHANENDSAVATAGPEDAAGGADADGRERPRYRVFLAAAGAQRQPAHEAYEHDAAAGIYHSAPVPLPAHGQQDNQYAAVDYSGVAERGAGPVTEPGSEYLVPSTYDMPLSVDCAAADMYHSEPVPLPAHGQQNNQYAAVDYSGVAERGAGPVTKPGPEYLVPSPSSAAYDSVEPMLDRHQILPTASSSSEDLDAPATVEVHGFNIPMANC